MTKNITSKGSKNIWSRSLLAAVTVTTASAGLTGLASAATISNTGPDSYNSISGGGQGSGGAHYGSGGYQMNGWNGQNTDWANDWESWNPEKWKNDGKSFDSWYNGSLNWLGQNASYQPWMSNNSSNYGSGNDWNDNNSYGGDDWSSWNPQRYQDDKGSYGDWYRQMVKHMDDNYDKWEKDWNNGSGNNNGRRSGGSGGDGSSTRVNYSNEESYSVENDTDTNIDNNVSQSAVSGDASSSRNTWGGDVSTGEASNVSENEFQVEVDNSSSSNQWSAGSGSGSGSGGFDWSSLNNTGPDSDNRVDYSNDVSYSVENDTDTNIDNNVSQSAVSGDASSSRNTHGGSVKSGDASNYSSNSFVVSVKN